MWWCRGVELGGGEGGGACGWGDLGRLSASEWISLEGGGLYELPRPQDTGCGLGWIRLPATEPPGPESPRQMRWQRSTAKQVRARTLLRSLRPKGGSPRVETCRKGRGRMERSSGMIYIYSIQEREGVVSFVRFSSGGYGVMAGRGELGVPVHPHRLHFNRDVFIFLCPWHECFRDSEEEGGGECSGSFVHLKQMSIRLVTCRR